MWSGRSIILQENNRRIRENLIGIEIVAIVLGGIFGNDWRFYLSALT